MTINNVKPDLLIFNNLASKKCKIYSCKVCPYFSNSYFLKINNFYLPIDFDTNCNTKSAVYAINFTLCKDIYYIGETGRLVSTRIKEHLRDIKHFIAYIQFNSVVSHHFNLKGHILDRDFKFYVLMVLVFIFFLVLFFSGFSCFFFLKEVEKKRQDKRMRKRRETSQRREREQEGRGDERGRG